MGTHDGKKEEHLEERNSYSEERWTPYYLAWCILAADGKLFMDQFRFPLRRISYNKLVYWPFA